MPVSNMYVYIILFFRAFLKNRKIKGLNSYITKFAGRPNSV